ncbi:hypothetical protein PFISCL1PPCAC_16790, partial [Pristionchus fissidentatus]
REIELDADIFDHHCKSREKKELQKTSSVGHTRHTAKKRVVSVKFVRLEKDVEEIDSDRAECVTINLIRGRFPFIVSSSFIFFRFLDICVPEEVLEIRQKEEKTSIALCIRPCNRCKLVEWRKIRRLTECTEGESNKREIVLLAVLPSNPFRGAFRGDFQCRK